MCGIAGMVRFAGLKPAEREVGAVMAATLHHRGPDDRGLYCDAYASLGHARLSIIDLQGGRQPLSNEDGTVWVCFNGEIFNHQSLADELRARGHRLKTRCDTEVIVHLYEDFGESFVDHLNGMFAIALWDARQHTLLLARDRLGVKPLYWHDDGRRIIFGSELKALTAAGGVEKRIDLYALQDYLTFGHVPAPRTIYQGIHKLEPGFLAVSKAAGTMLHRYWDIPFSADEADETAHDERYWVEQFAALLEDAVAKRLLADVPLGAFLSGGVDSAGVTAAMRRRSPGEVLTQTVGFEEADLDERAAARQVARQLGTEHYEVLVRPDAAWAAEKLAYHFDEPFADSSAVPTFYLAQAARQRVTVALSGDGGDELLAGYRRYRFDLFENSIRKYLPLWLRRCPAGVAGWLYPKGDWLPRPLRAKRTLQNLAGDVATGHLRSVSLAAGTLPHFLLRPHVQAHNADYVSFARGRDLFIRCPSRQILNRLLYMDLKTLLPDDMLTKVDRASMAVGLEVRTPLLDYRLVELAARMPPTLKLAGRTDKYVLRQVLAKWLGPQFAQRRKKGFDVPVDAWFRGPLRDMAHDLLMGRNALCHEWIHAGAIKRIMDSHQGGLRRNGPVLWALLALELWARTFRDPPGPQVAQTAQKNGQAPAGFMRKRSAEIEVTVG